LTALRLPEWEATRVFGFPCLFICRPLEFLVPG
jgi:hypothetical protein